MEVKITIIVKICITAMMVTFVLVMLSGSVDSYNKQRERLLYVGMIFGVVTVETFLISIWMN